MSEPLPILDITQEFFTSPMWQDTIKDFVLANCNIFTGDDEYSLEHFNCHKQFCQVIEDTLNIYLLDIIGINFDLFQEACLSACQHPDSIASNVIHILKQATDFRYFAAKMYAYNVMLDREAAASFLIEGDDANAFFVTEGAMVDTPTLKEEAKIQDQEAQVATAQLNQVEAELGLAPTNPQEDLGLETEKPLPPKKQPPPILPPMEEPPKKEEPPAPAPTPSLSSTYVPTITEQQRNEMKRKILQEREAMNRTLDAEEIAKRKAAFEKRREQIVSQKREECKEQIDLNLQKHEKPVVVPEEDPMDAIRRALAGRVKNMIDEDH